MSILEGMVDVITKLTKILAFRNVIVWLIGCVCTLSRKDGGITQIYAIAVQYFCGWGGQFAFEKDGI